MASEDVIRDMADTLVYLLRASLTIVPPSNILIATPDEFQALQTPPAPHVTLFLYRIAEHPQMRNLPRRTLTNGRTTRQLLPLELSYLITPWAKDTRDELRMAGRILQIFYDHAELGASDLQGTSWDSDDTVQLVLDSLPLEDHYRIWDASEVPYRLSLTYVARVIGITPTASVGTAPIVTARIGGAS